MSKKPTARRELTREAVLASLRQEAQRRPDDRAIQEVLTRWGGGRPDDRPLIDRYHEARLSAAALVTAVNAGDEAATESLLQSDNAVLALAVARAMVEVVAELLGTDDIAPALATWQAAVVAEVLDPAE